MCSGTQQVRARTETWVLGPYGFSLETCNCPACLGFSELAGLGPISQAAFPCPSWNLLFHKPLYYKPHLKQMSVSMYLAGWLFWEYFRTFIGNLKASLFWCKLFLRSWHNFSPTVNHFPWIFWRLASSSYIFFFKQWVLKKSKVFKSIFKYIFKTALPK